MHNCNMYMHTNHTHTHRRTWPQAERAAKEQLAVALEGVKGEAARAANALEGEQTLVKALRAEVEGLNGQVAALEVGVERGDIGIMHRGGQCFEC